MVGKYYGNECDAEQQTDQGISVSPSPPTVCRQSCAYPQETVAGFQFIRPVFRYKIYLDKQKQPPYIDRQKQCIIK